MSLLMHLDDFVDEEHYSYEDLRDSYVREVEDDAMASLNEIKNVHNDDCELTAKEFCEKHNLI